MYQEDEILMEKWAAEEKERRLKQGPIYTSSKAKRNIEGLQSFGHVEETEDVSKLRKNVVGDDILSHLPSAKRMIPSDAQQGENTIESFFEGVDDDKFEKDVNKAAERKEKAEALRLQREAKRASKMTDADKQFKALAETDSDMGTLAQGKELAKEDTKIVGRAPRGSVDREILGAESKKALTVE